MDQHAAGPVAERERMTAVAPPPSAFAFYYWFSFISPAVLAGRKAAAR
jgi:hypothetical protein